MKSTFTGLLLLFTFFLSAQIQPPELENSNKAIHPDSIRVIAAITAGDSVYSHANIGKNINRFFSIDADTMVQDFTHSTDTIFRNIIKVVQQGDIVTSPNTDDQIITDFSVVGDTLYITIEDGNTKSAILSGISTQPEKECHIVSTNYQVFSTAIPADSSKYEVQLKEQGYFLSEVSTLTHPGEFLVASDTLKFYENKENEEICLRVID